MAKITEFMTITELSPLLGVTRPTLYKYKMDYESGDVRNIKAEIIAIFDYITKEAKNKLDIIHYIETQSSDNESLVKALKVKITKNKAFKQLMEFILQSNQSYESMKILLEEQKDE